MINTRVKAIIRRIQLHVATKGYPFRDAETGRRYKRIHHFHIRKTAGTSLNTSFWRLCSDASSKVHGRGRFDCQSDTVGLPHKLVFVRQDEGMLRDGRYHIGYSHQPAWLLDLPADTFTLTILRDPLRRLQSYYRYLLWVRRQYSRDFGDLRVAETGWQTLLTEAEALGLDGSESLRNLVERAPAQHVLNQLWMFSETLDPGEAAERIRACSAVLRTEYFAEDLAGLSTRLGIPLRVYHERGYDYSGLPEPTVEELAFAREALAAEYAMLDELGISLRC